MQAAMQGNHKRKADIVFLPFIDLPPSDETTIMSTLQFVANLAKMHDFTPVLTFDQPLYNKALKI